ncbi:hypothetical protein [Crossiella sp. CA198]|uniref:hypothetical protein n=1 Tax=Crossiella sp. CA198 TaxID=3455607 RepID=UPI003F8D67D1
MSTLTALARAHAAHLGRAQPITTVRHVHIADRPLVCVPLAMAGEANAPLAILVGQDRTNPKLIVVPQPRNRTQRFEFADSLALVVLNYLSTFLTSTGHAVEAPQVWVPSRAGIDCLRLFGRSTRLRRTTGPYAVSVSVPRLGTWLSFLAERAGYPGSSMLLAATDVLAQHWATGQSAYEDSQLAAQFGWVEPPPGMTGPQAARVAEDPIRCPPAGPVTDPTFDREVLAPAIAEYDAAASRSGQARAIARLEGVLLGQLDPTWHLLWRVIDRLRQLPAGEHVAARWSRDREDYLRFHDRVATGGLPQPKRDSAVAAAIGLNDLERRQAAYDAQRAFDDPLVMAEHRLSGDAFVGTVTTVLSDRRIGAGRGAVLRPLITVATSDRVRLQPGEANLHDQTRPKQRAEIISMTATTADELEITVQLAGGMGRGRTPAPRSVPAVGDRVCFSNLTDSFQPRGTFPDREDTPWTHGGPPVQPGPVNDTDAAEEWS